MSQHVEKIQNMHNDYEKLDLNGRVGVTDEVIALLRREKERLRKVEKRKVSVAKLVCNLVIEKYGEK